MTVGEWSASWLASQVHLKATTRATYEALYRKHVAPRWSSVALAKVRHEDVAGWVQGLVGSGLSASTVRQTYRVLSMSLAAAVMSRRLAVNPAAGVRLPRLSRSEHVYLSHTQVDELAAASGRYELLIYFLAYTGVRFGEAAGLRVGRVDLVRRRARVVEAVAEVGGRAVFDSPKNHQTRSVPIPSFLASRLADSTAGFSPSAFVFAAPKGGVLRLGNFRRESFERAVAESGVPRLTPHELRHTAASLAIAAGANVKVVQQMLGHKSATMTLDLYGHLFADQLDLVADAMEAARGQSADFLRTSAVLDGLPDPTS